MNRFYLIVLGAMFVSGCRSQAMPGPHSSEMPAAGAEQRQICFVVEELGDLDGKIELWLQNDNPEMFDNGDWFPGYAANIGERKQCVTSGFLMAPGDPIRVSGRYKLEGNVIDWHYLAEFVNGEPRSHIMLDTFEVDGLNQGMGEIVDNGHHGPNGEITGVDDQFIYRQ